jgi:hypothetical protein
LGATTMYPCAAKAAAISAPSVLPVFVMSAMLVA